MSSPPYQPGYPQMPAPMGAPPEMIRPGFKPDGRRRGPNLLAALVLLGAGVVFGGVALVAIVRGAMDILRSERLEVPGSVEMTLDQGDWTLYRRSPIPMSLASVDIEGPAEVEIRPRSRSVTESRTQGGATYEAWARLRVTESGTYRITVGDRADGGELRNTPGDEILISRPFGHLTRLGPWFVVGGIGGVLFMTGLVMMIVSLVNRGRARRTLAYESQGLSPLGPYHAPQMPMPPPPSGHGP